MAALGQAQRRWREQNPEQVQRLAARGIAAAHAWREKNRSVRYYRPASACATKWSELHRDRLSMAAAAQWHARSEAQRAAVGAAISTALVMHNAALTPTEKARKDAQLAKARERIDQTYLMQKQKEGRDAYWTAEKKKARSDMMKARWQNGAAQFGRRKRTTLSTQALETDS
jgi:DNA-binding PadR family transcriptional regulator